MSFNLRAKHFAHPFTKENVLKSTAKMTKKMIYHTALHRTLQKIFSILFENIRCLILKQCDIGIYFESMLKTRPLSVLLIVLKEAIYFQIEKLLNNFLKMSKNNLFETEKQLCGGCNMIMPI